MLENIYLGILKNLLIAVDKFFLFTLAPSTHELSKSARIATKAENKVSCAIF